MKEKYLTINGVEYFVRDTESGAESVLLMHGWPDDGTLWRHQIEFLAQKGYRVICPDWPAHGRSAVPDKISRGNRFRLAEDTITMMDQLGIEKAHLIAHDYGATVSWETAALYGHRFHTYVALSVGHSFAILRELFRGHLLHYYWLIWHGMSAARTLYLADNAKRFRRAFARHPDADYVLEKLRGDGDKTFFTIWERSNPAGPIIWDWITGKIRKVQIPTFAIYSEADCWMTEEQMTYSRRYVDAEWRYALVKDCDHWLQLERPEEINQLLERWLREHPAPEPSRAGAR